MVRGERPTTLSVNAALLCGAPSCKWCLPAGQGSGLQHRPVSIQGPTSRDLGTSWWLSRDLCLPWASPGCRGCRCFLPCFLDVTGSCCGADHPNLVTTREGRFPQPSHGVNTPPLIMLFYKEDTPPSGSTLQLQGSASIAPPSVSFFTKLIAPTLAPPLSALRG